MRLVCLAFANRKCILCIVLQKQIDSFVPMQKRFNEALCVCSLAQACTLAEDHLWLSPDVRLLADHPDIKEYVLDMDHHSIVLPPDQHPSSSIPLIVLGGECCLRLKNAMIYNADSLAACLSLGPGSRLYLEAVDGVELVNSAPVHFSDPVGWLERTVGRLPGAFTSTAPAVRPKSGHFQVCVCSVLPAV
jgi:hypothetical protein